MGLYLFDLFKKGTINANQRITLKRRYFVDSSEKMRPFEEWIESVHTGLDHVVFFLNARNAYGQEPTSEITRFHLEVAKRILEKFYFVGITEEFDDDAAFLFGKLRIQRFCKNHNVASRYYLPKNDKKMISLIVSRSHLDAELYDYARRLNREFKIQKKHFYFLSVHTKFKRFLSDLFGRTIRDV